MTDDTITALASMGLTGAAEEAKVVVVVVTVGDATVDGGVGLGGVVT